MRDGVCGAFSGLLRAAEATGRGLGRDGRRESLGAVGQAAQGPLLLAIGEAAVPVAR